MGVAIGQAKANIAGTIDSTNTANNVILAFGTVAAVAASTETTIVSYATGAAKATWITQIFCSGQENSKWRLFEATVAKIVLRIGAGQVNTEFNFTTPYKVSAGPVTIDIKAEHFITGETPTFEATILGYVEL